MGMRTIAPIETEYKGYRFRSRLEARWAVFFDEMQTSWLYEAEGYELPSGRRYLPDFYLPSIGVHVEVKPTKEIGDLDVEKLCAFAVDGNSPLLLLVGTPGEHTAFLLSRHTCQSVIEFWSHEEGTLVAEFWEEIASAVAEWSWDWRANRYGLHVPLLTQIMAIRVANACARARSARFEFGECAGKTSR